ncbi:putative serine protease K12H4.7 isoform X3 [Orbicella faveolata]|nr:putative serine protease K12H4.7 isoform X3 [Orbicella faveolata]
MLFMFNVPVHLLVIAGLGFYINLSHCSLRFLRGRPRGGMLVAPAAANMNRKLPEAHWFTQRLDHFDDSNTKTWQQRFFYNDSFHKKPDGPVFVMIGGEGEANPIWLTVGDMMKNAQLFGAFTLLLEHRFYGKSQPTSDMSDSSLKYLNSEQALADLAAFSQSMAREFNLTNSKWISFGGSYPGSLSAWFRLKYPHLVHGSVASSAPVFAKVNFAEYMDVVTASLATTGQECGKNIANATDTLHSLLSSEEGAKELSELFVLCKPLDKDSFNDVATFASDLSGNFAGVVQYNKDNRAFEGAVGTNITIDTLCDIMNDNDIGDPLARYAKVNSLILQTYGANCLDSSYNNLIASLRNTSWSSSASEGGRQWMYQTCTEFGFFQTSDSDKQPFGNLFPLKYSIQQCMDIFGPTFNDTNIQDGATQTNTNYGGYAIASSKIVFPNGSIDPWHALGIVRNVSTTEQAVYIQG